MGREQARQRLNLEEERQRLERQGIVHSLRSQRDLDEAGGAYKDINLLAMQLLRRVQRIERALGRRRLIDKGPRTVDIDILLYGGFVIQTAQLIVPHPRMHLRRFVLEPMAELAPNLRHPILGRTMSELRAAVLHQTVRRLTGEL